MTPLEVAGLLFLIAVIGVATWRSLLGSSSSDSGGSRVSPVDVVRDIRAMDDLLATPEERLERAKTEVELEELSVRREVVPIKKTLAKRELGRQIAEQDAQIAEEVLRREQARTGLHEEREKRKPRPRAEPRAKPDIKTAIETLRRKIAEQTEYHLKGRTIEEVRANDKSAYQAVKQLQRLESEKIRELYERLANE